MNDKQRFQDMFNQQQELLNKLEDERDLDSSEVDNIKALIHETVELEHGIDWKWWTNDVEATVADHYDVTPENRSADDRLTEEELDAYMREEIVDIWHFLIQEAIMTELVQVDDVAKCWTDAETRIEHLQPVGDYVKLMRQKALDYDQVMPKYAQTRLLDLFINLSRFTKQHFDDLDDLHGEYMDKNEENKDRQDGDVDGREEYDSSDMKMNCDGDNTCTFC